MNLLARQTPAGPGPPGFDLGPYQTVPLLNQRSPLLGITITFIVCSWICLLLRLYVRFIIQRSGGWDDFFLILTMLSTTTGSVVLCIMTNMGLGKPIFTLSLAELQAILKPTYVVICTYPLSSTFIKVALLLQYLRVFPDPRTRMLCKCMLGVSILLGVAFTFCTIFTCYPIAAFWDFSIRGVCWGFASLNQLEFMRIMVAQAVSAAVFDFVVFLIPLWQYFKTDALKASRLSVLGLFVLGLVANVCSVWRVAYVIKVTLSEKRAFDPVWDNPTVMGLSSYEVHLAAVCSALPVFWPIVKTTWNRIMVTFEVSVTKEYGVFPFKKAGDVELQLGSLGQNQASDAALQPQGWEPFVGDETTGVGENETVVESLATGKRSKTVGDILRNKPRS